MSINASKVPSTGKNSTEQQILDIGVYPGRLVQVLDLGLQAQRPYQGKDKPPAHEIMLTYELADAFMVDENGDDIEDKPRLISEQMALRSLTADLAKSTKRYNALDPNSEFGGDFGAVVETPVNITIVHNQSKDKTYMNVGGIAPMRPKDALRCPPLVNPTKTFDLDAPDLEVFKSLPEWIQTKICENLEFKGSKLEALLAGKPEKEEKAAPKKKEKKEPVGQDDEDEDAPW